jgi:transposase
MNRIEIEKLRRYLNENLVKEFIRISRSHVVSFVMFVKKSEKELHFYVNYRVLNVITIKNRYSLSLIVKILHRLTKIKIFIKINIIVVFNMFRIREEDEELIIFRTRFNLFESLILSFDLCNELISFQHFINDT